MIDYLINIDSDFMLMLNGTHTAYLDRVMVLVSDKWVWTPFYAALVMVLTMKYRIGACLVALFAVVLAVTLADQTCASIIRPVVERLRPSNIANPLSECVITVNGYRGGAYGFPSCHAANSFALAVFMALTVRHRWFSLVLFGWAVLNSYSRVYLGVHYPGDLIAGAILGSFFGFVCYWLSSRINHRQRFPMSDAHGVASLTLGVTVVTVLAAAA